MAYTKYGGGDEELDKILHDYGSRYDTARQTGDVKGMREANDQANQARNAKGYAAELANDDIEYVKRKTGYGSSKASGGSSGGFSYESAPAYASKYQSQIDELTKQILGRAAFEYDPESDPTYEQYRKTYTREGQRAMQDTLGEVSARTGGLASSYAASAANQANDYYMGQLADKVPELRQLAYQMYQDEENKMRSDLDMLMGLDGADYGKYADLLGQFNVDRDFAYGAGRDQVADQRYADETAYNRGQDTKEWAWNEEGRDYDRQQDQYAKDADRAALLAAAGNYSGFASLWGLSAEETQGLVDEYARAKKLDEDAAARELADWYAKYGDFSGLKAQGVDTSYAETMQKGELWHLAQQMTGGGSGRGGSSGGGGSVKSSADPGEEKWVIDAMLGYGDDARAYEYLVRQDLSSGKTEKLWEFYQNTKKNTVPVFSDYSSAVSYLKNKGVSGNYASGAMTQQEWARRKASYQQYGQGGTEVAEYDSYSDYLTAYVQYCIESYGK